MSGAAETTPHSGVCSYVGEGGRGSSVHGAAQCVRGLPGKPQVTLLSTWWSANTFTVTNKPVSSTDCLPTPHIGVNVGLIGLSIPHMYTQLIVPYATLTILLFAPICLLFQFFTVVFKFLMIYCPLLTLDFRAHVQCCFKHMSLWNFSVSWLTKHSVNKQHNSLNNQSIQNQRLDCEHIHTHTHTHSK